MRKFTFHLSFLSIFLLIAAIGLANHVTPFHTIHVAGNVEVVLELGEEENVEFEGDPSNTTINFKNGILKIKKLKLREVDERVKVRVTYKRLYEIKVSTGASISSTNVIEVESLTLLASTGSSAELDFSANHLDIKASEGSVIRVGGKCESLGVRANSGGEVDAYQLESNHCYARASTGGIANVNVSETLETATSMGGEVNYRGDPYQVSTKSNLGGYTDKQ